MLCFSLRAVASPMWSRLGFPLPLGFVIALSIANTNMFVWQLETFAIPGVMLSRSARFLAFKLS